MGEGEGSVFMERHLQVQSGRSGGAGRRIWGSLPPVWAPWNTWGNSCSRPRRGRGLSPPLCSDGGGGVGLSRTMGVILMMSPRCRRSCRPLSSRALLRRRCSPPLFEGLPWLSCRLSSLCSRFLPSATWTRTLTQEKIAESRNFLYFWEPIGEEGEMIKTQKGFCRNLRYFWRRLERKKVTLLETSLRRRNPRKGKSKNLWHLLMKIENKNAPIVEGLEMIKTQKGFSFSFKKTSYGQTQKSFCFSFFFSPFVWKERKQEKKRWNQPKKGLISFIEWGH